MADYKQLVESKRQAMLDALLLSIERNPKKWESGWVSVDVPFNAATNKNYSGLNALFLDVKAQLSGFNDARWVTFNQAKELGASIKSGEKASEVFYWSKYDKATKKPFDRATVEGMTEEERAEYIKENVRPVLKFYQVFNAAQCKNFPESTKRSTIMSDEERAHQNEQIENIIRNSAAPIIYDGKAYYSPHKDNIHLPTVHSFKSMQDYYATALHEIGHSTGHQSRLNRDLTGIFGSESYAIEELRAELASVFLQTELGIKLEGAEIANHGAYLKSWLAAVKKDVNVFYRAAADAGKISDYIKDNYMKASKLRTQEENQSQETEIKTNDTMKAKEIAEAKAIKEGIAYVVIEWSEHSSLNNNTILTFAEADKQLQALNTQEKEEGYYKTKLHVCCPSDDGQADWFNDCRFNIGYELDGGLIRLISDYDEQGVPSEERYAIKTFVRELKAHIEPKTEQKNDINDSIKEWYGKNYPGDEFAKLLSEGVTFKDLQSAIDAGTDVYDTIGANDSVVRERLFAQLADIQGKQYEDLYNAWMSKLEQIQQAQKATEQARLMNYEMKALNVVLNSNGAIGEYISFEGFNHAFNTQQLVTKYGGKIENGQIVVTQELQNSYAKLQSQVGKKEPKENQTIKQVGAGERGKRLPNYTVEIFDVIANSPLAEEARSRIKPYVGKKLDVGFADKLVDDVTQKYGKKIKLASNDGRTYLIDEDYFVINYSISKDGRKVYRGFVSSDRAQGIIENIKDRENDIVSSPRLFSHTEIKEAQDNLLRFVPELEQAKQVEQVEQVQQVGASEKPLVVNLFAGPGAGKTTAALELTAALKKVGYNVEYVSEYAKELVLEKRTDLLQDQKHVTDNQYQRLDRLRNSGVEIIVTDSPVLLGKIYGEGKIDEAYSRQIEGYHKSFESFNLYVQRGMSYQIEGRLQTKSEAQALDKKITAMLKEQGVFYGVYDKENVGKTVDRISKTFNRLFKKENTKANSQQSRQSRQVQQVEQVGQAQKAKQVEIVLPIDCRMKDYGKATMFKMPQGVEYSSFVFLAPTSMVQVSGNQVRLVVPSKFEFTLKDDGRELKLTGEEMRTVIDGKEIGKSAQRIAPSKRNVARLEALKSNVPEEMKEMPNWCVYRSKWNEEKGKKDKFVLSVHDGKWARINDSSTWTDFETAYQYAIENNCEGLSFALDGSGITCIDLDKCIVKNGQINGVATSQAEGELNDIAKKLVPAMSDTYCERSASGNGLHFFLRDDVLAKETFANRAELPGGDEIEVYDTARFISMTGDLFGKSEQSNLSDKSNKLGKCPIQTMNWIRTALGPKNKIETTQRSTEHQSTDLRYQSDSEVLARIRRSKKGEQFDTLYNGGDVTGDKSRDDLMMLNTLAFFTDCNQQQMRSIFEGSGRFRPETKNAAYVTRSIQKACDSLTVRFGQQQTSKPNKGKK